MARHPRNHRFEGLEKRPLKKVHPTQRELLDALDECPEFHDPYSELNLFLSQKIKKEMRHCSNSKKWSVELQEELLNKIAPEFQERFPKYRLGITALKKTWEKVNYFATQIQGEKNALTQDGKLNLSFFIKENLKTASKMQKSTCHLHPYHYAHQLAVKMSECIAVVDGIRPKLDQLTRTIWSLQRHLIPNLAPEHFKSPYDENEKIDKLIVKTLLEITAKHPQISQAELAFHVQKRLIQVRLVTKNYTESQIEKMLAALYADQCHFTSGRMEKVLERIPYPIAKCLKNELASIIIDSPNFRSEKVCEDAFSFFSKAREALEETMEEKLERKIQNWTIQGDMLQRWVRLNDQSALFKETMAHWHLQKPFPFACFVSRILQSYLEKYPHLVSFARDVEIRIWIYLKYLWYTEGFENGVATYDRFIKWHKHLIKPLNLSSQEIVEKIEELSKKMLPLLPFNRPRAQTILFTEEENQTH